MAVQKKTPVVLVFVTDQRSSERLIRAGKKLATEGGLPLHILSIQPPRATLRIDTDALEHLMSVARRMDAEMTVLYAPHAVSAVAAFLQQQPAAHFVLGVTRQAEDTSRTGPFISALRDAFPAIPFHLVAPDGVMLTLPEYLPPQLLPAII